MFRLSSLSWIALLAVDLSLSLIMTLSSMTKPPSRSSSQKRQSNINLQNSGVLIFWLFSLFLWRAHLLSVGERGRSWCWQSAPLDLHVLFSIPATIWITEQSLHIHAWLNTQSMAYHTPTTMPLTFTFKFKMVRLCLCDPYSSIPLVIPFCAVCPAYFLLPRGRA